MRTTPHHIPPGYVTGAGRIYLLARAAMKAPTVGTLADLILACAAMPNQARRVAAAMRGGE